MKKLMMLLLCAASTAHGATTITTTKNTSADILIALTNKSSDAANIDFHVQITGSNEKDIAKIVELVTTIVGRIESGEHQSQQSMFKVALMAAAIPTFIGCALGLGLYWQSRD